MNELTLNGFVGDSFDGITFNAVKSYADQNEKVEIVLSSEGGSSIEGLAIFAYLVSIDKPVNIKIVGRAASAASVIAMAGKKGGNTLSMQSNSLIMIHPASGCVCGTSKDIEKGINAIDAIDESFIGIYAKATGLDKKKIESLYFNETWINAKDALEMGFISSIFEELSMSDKTPDVQAIAESAALQMQVSDLNKRIATLESENIALKAESVSSAAFISAAKEEKIKPYESYLTADQKASLLQSSLDNVSIFAESMAKAAMQSNLKTPQTTGLSMPQSSTQVSQISDRAKVNSLIPKEAQK